MNIYVLQFSILTYEYMNTNELGVASQLCVWMSGGEPGWSGG